MEKALTQQSDLPAPLYYFRASLLTSEMVIPQKASAVQGVDQDRGVCGKGREDSDEVVGQLGPRKGQDCSTSTHYILFPFPRPDSPIWINTIELNQLHRWCSSKMTHFTGACLT